ncbi:MAG: glycosyltransferase [Halomonadaceae bacterium]
MPTSNQNSATRLALYLPSLRGGGAERVMVLLANGFAQRGYAVDLVLASAEGPYFKDVDEAVRVIDLKAGRVIKSLLPLVRYLRRERPTTLLSAMGHANVIAVAARSIAQVTMRVVASEHSNFSASMANRRSLRVALVRQLMHILYRRADSIVAVSAGVADDLVTSLSLPREQVLMIYNPIVTPQLYEKANDSCEHPWLQSNEPPVILAVGRLTHAKDFGSLLKAFSRLCQSHPSRLIILGEGELRSELERLIKTHELGDVVDLPGFVDNPFSFMRRSALFVLSSGWEGFGNVLVEAMACGAPVISTDCPSGPAEILENGKWGRLVPVGDVEALADAMSLMLVANKHPSVASRAATFNLDNAVNSYLNVMLPDQHKGIMHDRYYT